MTEPCLTCVWFADLSDWERKALRPVVTLLKQLMDVEEVDVPASAGNVQISARGTDLWLFTRRWRWAMGQLDLPKNARVFLSVLGRETSEQWLVASFWKKMQATLPAQVTLVTHSPMSYRFLTEMERIPVSQCRFLPLPVETSLATSPKSADPSRRSIVIGTVARFTPEANLHYLMNVAHYVSTRSDGISFRLLGSGPLADHLGRIARELALSERVSLHDWSPERFTELDLFFYSPLQNYHFLPLHLAASQAMAIVSGEVPGVETLLEDGKTGFLVPVNETKPMGELLLRLAKDFTLRQSLGQNLITTLRQKAAPQSLATEYAKLFSVPRDPATVVTQVA